MGSRAVEKLKTNSKLIPLAHHIINGRRQHSKNNLRFCVYYSILADTQSRVNFNLTQLKGRITILPLIKRLASSTRQVAVIVRGYHISHIAIFGCNREVMTYTRHPLQPSLLHMSPLNTQPFVGYLPALRIILAHHVRLSLTAPSLILCCICSKNSLLLRVLLYFIVFLSFYLPADG